MAKVLVTGTSAGIGLQTAIVMGRAGHTVYATMRNLERGVALRAVVEKERLPISILTMDVDSDESVDAATSAIRAQTGTIDALVNNAGIERTGSIEGIGVRRLQGRDGNQLLWRHSHDSSMAARHANKTEWLHRQRLVRGRADFVLAADGVRRLEIRARGVQRRARPGGQTLQRPRRDRPARDHRHSYGPTHRAPSRGRRVSTGQPVRSHVRGVTRDADAAGSRCREDSGHHRKWHTEAPPSRRARRRGVSWLARVVDR